MLNHKIMIVIMFTIALSIFSSACSIKEVENDHSKLQKDPLNISEDVTNVLYDYANNINDKKYDLALKDLGPILCVGTTKDDEFFKNIDNIEIISLQDKTGVNSNGRWYVNPRDVGDVFDSRVYFAEIKYKLNHTAFCYLIDGTNYFKIVFIKTNKDASWKIGEMSSAEKDWGNEE